MKKYKNVSGKDIGFIVDGKTYDFQNGQIVSVPEGVKERIDYLISKIVPVEEEKPVTIPVMVIKPATPIITPKPTVVAKTRQVTKKVKVSK